METKGNGSLWLSDKKTKDGDEYWNGSIEIDGVSYFLSMFKRRAKENDVDGKRYPLFNVVIGAKKDVQKSSEWGAKLPFQGR